MAKIMGEAHEIPTIWTTGWTTIFNTGTWRSAIPVHQRRFAPCQNSCPVNGDIPTWIQQLKEREYQKAWLTLVNNNPFPAITGRVCHHPCELACNRKDYDENISVKAMERFLGDLALERGWQLPSNDLGRKETIAVVGAGPAGLSAAYQLHKRGFGVVVYEARQKPGGLLTYGIPAYRLPREILEGEIERLLKIGIKLETGFNLKDYAALMQLKEKHAAVFMATGAQRFLNLPGLNESEYLGGLQFLEQVNAGKPPQIGKKVVVVGGGNTAVDSARCALRLGCRDVTILYRRDREQMPAQLTEVHEAEKEGVKLMLLAAPLSVKQREQKQELFCQRMQLGETDESGRKRPLPIEGDTFVLESDTLIAATGTQPELDQFGELFNKAGQIDAGKGFFAGGDLTGTDRYVSSAVGAGRLGAAEIACYLGCKENNDVEDANPVAFNEINTFYFPSNPAVKQHQEAVEDRIADFREVEIGISMEEAISESRRCFSCGNCLHCDNCFYFCPDMAVQRADNPEEGYRVLDQYCKGCGICVTECPRGAIVLKEEIK